MPNFSVNTKLSPEDNRDYLFIPDSEGPFPPSLDLMPFVQEVEDQAQYGTCVANALCADCESIGKKHGLSLDLSRMYVYMRGRQLSGLGPETEGMVPRDALKAAKQWGIPPEADWPYTEINQHATPPASVDAIAALSKIQKYEAVITPGFFGPYKTMPEKIMRIKAALNQGMRVRYASWVTESLRHLTGPWQTHDYKLLSEDDMIGAHEWVIIGYDDSAQKFLCQNSWGPEYGDGGFFGFPYLAVDETGVEAWVTRNYAGMYNRQVPSIKREFFNFANLAGRIVPPVNLVGTLTNIYIAALSPTGQKYYKTALNNNNWLPIAEWTDAQPVAADCLLTDTVDLWVMQNYDVFGNGLNAFAGYSVFIAYGQSVQTATQDRICIIPYFAL